MQEVNFWSGSEIFRLASLGERYWVIEKIISIGTNRDLITEREVTFTYQMAFIWSCKWKRKSLSPVWLFEIPGLYSPWNSLRQNTGVGSLSLLQGIFPTQESKSGLPHGRQILYQLSHRKALIWSWLYLSLGFPGGSVVRNPSAIQELQETWVWFLVEEGIATHSSILAWRNPWTEELGRLSPQHHKDMTEVTYYTCPPSLMELI